MKRLKNFKAPVPGTDTKFWSKALAYHYIYNTLVLLIGSVFIFFGGWMITKGVTGKIDWIIALFGNDSKLLNASPGAFMALIGLFIILFRKSEVEHTS